MSSDDPRKNWFEEVQSAWLYRRVAAAEPDQRKRRLFESLADAALEQARTWQTAAGMSAAAGAGFRPTLRARVVADTFISAQMPFSWNESLMSLRLLNI